MSNQHHTPLRGRGTAVLPPGRFASVTCEPGPGPAGPAPATVLRPERSASIISRNRSPDLNFRQSINPYRGCEHGCVYCYARPSHAYMDLSPGLEFETQIFYKPDAVARLRETLARPGYRCQPIALGANTDPYQPAERRLGITRALLGVLAEHHHPVVIVTKSALVERDLDLLVPMAQARLARVMVSVTTLDDELKRRLEPRTASPARRLRCIETLAAAGVPVGALVAPVIPGLNDPEVEAIVAAVAAAGADQASYILLRLPHEVRGLFEDWLATHYPLRAAHVMSLVRQCRDGRANDPCFGSRMRGTGPLAALLARRFARACRAAGLAAGDTPALDTTAFRAPAPATPQLALF